MTAQKTSAPKFWLKVFITMCALAFMGGVQQARDAQLTLVPNDTVAPWWCSGGTHVVKVYEHTTNPGVYDIHCSDGVTVEGGRK
jgi:hypothetical protein